MEGNKKSKQNKTKQNKTKQNKTNKSEINPYFQFPFFFFSAAMYGMANSFPDRSVIADVATTFIDTALDA